jgi:hypothetical protein
MKVLQIIHSAEIVDRRLTKKTGIPMTATRPSISVCAALCVVTLFVGTDLRQPAGAAEAPSPENAPSPDNVYLDGLRGDWDMTGTLLGKPVKYHARGERVLQGGFLRLHLTDLGAAPNYEAELFLGYDAHAGDYIVHWLDRFGAAGARVVATGKRSGETLVVLFPYAEGAFRNTYTFDPKSHGWSLVIESQAAGGAWSNFATYTLVHSKT